MRARVTGTSLLSHIGAVLALAGVVAATVAAGLSATPAGASKLDRATKAARSSRVPQVRRVGLDHTGGDMKRAVRVTRRASKNRAAQRLSWAGVALIVPRQATAVTVSIT